MRDWIAALLIGTVVFICIIAGLIVLPLLVPVLFLLALICVIWFIIQIAKDPPDSGSHPPPL